MRARLLGALAFSFAAIASCKSTEPFVPFPKTIVLTVQTISFSALGQSQSVTAAVADQRGDSISQPSLTWESSDGAVAEVRVSTRTAATVVAKGNGSARIRVSSGTVTAEIAVTVAQAFAAIVKTTGDGQVDTVGRVLPLPLVAKVGDAAGNPMANIRVDFQITSGSGTLSAREDTSGVDGLVRVNWTLGTAIGTQAVRFTDPNGAAGAVSFHATARSGPAAALTVVAGDSQRAGAGRPVALPPTVRLRDAFNNPVANVAVTFEPTMGGGSVNNSSVISDANGTAAASWTLGASAGVNQLTVMAPGGLSYTFTATAWVPGPPADIVVTVGDGQTGLVGYALNVPPAVRVQDTAGIPLANVHVDFVPSGGGSVTGGSSVTDSVGVATVGGWMVAVGPNTLTASVTGSSISPAILTATGQTEQYNIQLRYLTPVTIAQQAAFENARTRWQHLIFGDEPDVPVNIGAGTCGTGTPAINETIDDIVIWVRLDSIDGPGKVLGQAGPCIIRSAGSLPLVGLMHFDTADVAQLLTAGQFDLVILHEMAHVMGFTAGIWSRLGLIVDPTSSGGTDPHFTGTTATSAFDGAGGRGYSAGAKVPLENCATCGAGTRDSHWRESVFDSELMTGFIESSGSDPLSVITTAAMGDMGHTVNYAASDGYTVAHVAGLRALTGPPIQLKDDVLPLPILVVDRVGRVVRVIPPR